MPIYAVLVCTRFAAAAQVMMKFGAGHPVPNWPLPNRLQPARLQRALADSGVAGR